METIPAQYMIVTPAPSIPIILLANINSDDCPIDNESQRDSNCTVDSDKTPDSFFGKEEDDT